MKQKTVFFCAECGNETSKWAGQCSACGAWNSIKEAPAAPKTASASAKPRGFGGSVPQRLSELDVQEEIRFGTGIGELDRVLGGGAVRGSIVLVGGSPGVGKSTLLLQLCGLVGKDEKILYVTGEESRRQLKMRAQRLHISDGDIFVLAETNLDEITQAIDNLEPTIVIIDSIQTMFNPDVSAAPGSVSQVRECTMAVMRQAKTAGFTAFVVGHINKEGSIAGPKVLEHMVDCVLYFEGEQSMAYRILRAAKNRFGSTNEIGVFEMADTGLREVPNPSETLLSGRPENTPGTCVTCVMEGSRPILAEVQALVAQGGYGSSPRRNCNSNGIDMSRALLLIAVLEKRGGMAISGCDAFINVVGGLQLDEPAADLATILALASSHRDVPINASVAAIGEVGLSGEVRSVSNLNLRLSEIARLGFKSCILPAHIKGDVQTPEGLELIRVKNVREAIVYALL